ncbi:MAG: hypothetical protein OXC69_06300 [Candidatus Tectomicrobia bacterium]|nr:hypothetical protein [Candidatus Tectomicrobia bacterium]
MMDNAQEVLEQCFFDYRAENLYKVFGEIFVKPPFFDDLAGARPCFLIGGRGTGKTTALKSLRYDAVIDDPNHHLGIYIRINKNQVHCFQSDLHGRLLRKAFSHYFNLLVAQDCSRLLCWMCNAQGVHIPDSDLGTVYKSLNLATDTGSLEHLEEAITAEILRLEIFVNNVDAVHDNPPIFSAPESPVRAIAQLVSRIDTLGRPLLCCIDEYENLLEYQQAAVNTYIKHSEIPLSYKVGMKFGGLKTHDTLTEGDPLRTPADFKEIHISNSVEDGFFEQILDRRMHLARQAGIGIPHGVNDFLIPISRLEEADELGAKDVAANIRKVLTTDFKVSAWASNIPDGDLILVKYRAGVENADLMQVARKYMRDEDAWRNVRNNHGFASLFWLSLGRRGARRRKYYCGLSTILHIARGNIRFFLELVGDSVKEALPSKLSDPIVVQPQQQTDAARAVATRQLEQLDSLGSHGGELKKMVLGIGKVFFELTRRPEGKAPEPTSFVLNGRSEEISLIQKLLKEGIANLVFVRTPRTKSTSDVEIRDDEYSLHPILAPFFEISYRRKRRITLSASALYRLQSDSKTAMAQLLKNVDQTPTDDLPEQLAIFSSLYGS